MRKTAALILLVLVIASCTMRTDLGECVGLMEDKDPALHYKVSAWNLFWAIVGIELIAPPIIVLATAWACPTSKAKETNAIPR